MFIINFIHFAGIIIALGSVTVIDTLGLIGRKSKEWTTTTIKAHHITKPLIWLGTIMVLVSWLFIYQNNLLNNIKSILLVILILNGSFLSFYVSAQLDSNKKNSLLPMSLQIKITISAIISFICWWSLVMITVLIK